METSPGPPRASSSILPSPPRSPRRPRDRSDRNRNPAPRRRRARRIERRRVRHEGAEEANEVSPHAGSGGGASRLPTGGSPRPAVRARPRPRPRPRRRPPSCPPAEHLRRHVPPPPPPAPPVRRRVHPIGLEELQQPFRLALLLPEAHEQVLHLLLAVGRRGAVALAVPVGVTGVPRGSRLRGARRRRPVAAGHAVVAAGVGDTASFVVVVPRTRSPLVPPRSSPSRPRARASSASSSDRAPPRKPPLASIVSSSRRKASFSAFADASASASSRAAAAIFSRRSPRWRRRTRL